MKFITTVLQKLMPKDPPKILGRWRLENCHTQMNHKVDLSNEDHCGPCGQYALEKVKHEVRPPDRLLYKPKE